MGTKTNRQLLGTHSSLEFEFTITFKYRRMGIHGWWEHFKRESTYKTVTLPFTPSIGWFCIEGVVK